MSETESDVKFTKFCAELERIQGNVFQFIRNQVAEAMITAGEDVENQILLATRTQQFMYGLNSHAGKEYEKSIVESGVRPHKHSFLSCECGGTRCSCGEHSEGDYCYYLSQNAKAIENEPLD